MVRVFWLFLLFLIGCGDGVTSPVISYDFVPSAPAEPPAEPFRHPTWTRDTTWNEDSTGIGFINTLTDWGTDYSKPWSHTIVTDTLDAVRKGWKSQRFEVRTGDCYGWDCTRSPVYERNEWAETSLTEEGDEFWYGWSFYVPSNMTGASWVFMGQFQQHPSGRPMWMFLKRAGQPFCAIRDFELYNHWNCNGVNGTYPLIDDGHFLGQWHDVVVHAKWTTQNTGFTRIWVNDVLVVDYTGYTKTSENHVYMKYGIYRHSSSGTSVVYYDEIRRGKTRNEVDIRLLER